ncbi:MAG: hypothetical protein K9J21_07185 [Bacteroidales bacterium]|nr:hypothetical protein [Bacteroidales bacterium]
MNQKHKDEQREPDVPVCDCGEIAEYKKTIPRRIDDIIFDESSYYCEDCMREKYKKYLMEVRDDCEYYGDPIPTFTDFLTDENINEL